MLHKHPYNHESFKIPDTSSIYTELLTMYNTYFYVINTNLTRDRSTAAVPEVTHTPAHTVCTVKQNHRKS